MNNFDILVLLDKMISKTNNACNKLDKYYIIYELPIDKN